MPLNNLGTLRTEINSGLKLDPYPLQPVLWIDGDNIHFGPNGVEKIKGFSATFATTPTKPIRGMVQLLNSSGTQQLFFGDQNDIYRSNALGAPVSVGSGFTGNLNETVSALASTWSMTNFGDFIMATNGVDTPQIYKGTSFANLAGINFTTAEIFVKRGPHVLALNLNTDNREFKWSDEDAPEVWVPTASNAAGDLLIRELESQIMAAVPLGDRIAIYGKDSMYIVTYVGTPNYFGYKPGPNGIGAVGKKAVVARGRLNYGLSQQGFWETDGVTFRYIDDGEVRDFLQDNLNFSQASKVNGYNDELNNQITWYLPTGTGEPEIGLSFNYQNRTWSRTTNGFTSSIERQVFTNSVVADKDGDVFFNNFGVDADGAALSANIQSTAVDLGQPDLIKEISAVRIGYIGSGLRFRIGTSDTADGTPTFGSFIENPVGYEFTAVQVAGRYIFLDLDSQDIGDKWSVEAIDFYGRLGGTR